MTALATLIARGGAASPVWYRGLIVILTAFLLLFHLYCGVYGPPTNIVFLPIHLLTTLAILFLIHPLGRQWSDPLVPASAIDLLCVGFCLAVAVYFLDSIDDYQLRIVDLRPLDRIVSILLVGLVLEAVRRTVGWSLIVIVFVLLRPRAHRRSLPRRVLRAADLVRFAAADTLVRRHRPVRHPDLRDGAVHRPVPAVRPPAAVDRRRRLLHPHCLCAVRTSGRRAGQGRRRVVRPVRHRVGERGEQRAHHRRLHHPDDEPPRLPAGLCRRRGVRRGGRRRHHAAGHGGGRLHDGRVHRRALRGGRHRRRHPGAAFTIWRSTGRSISRRASSACRASSARTCPIPGAC